MSIEDQIKYMVEVLKSPVRIRLVLGLNIDVDEVDGHVLNRDESPSYRLAKRLNCFKACSIGE